MTTNSSSATNSPAKGYKINYTSNTVYVNHKFYAEAQRDFFSAEAEVLRKIKEAFPSMKIVEKAGRKITTPRPTKRLTYENMEKHIKAYDNADELLAHFETVKALSVVVKSPYKYVRDWFEAQFPNYNDPTSAIENTLTIDPVVAPAIEKYKAKEEKKAS